VCIVEETYQRVIWQNGSGVMSFDRNVVIPGDRVKLTGTGNSYNLEITNINIWDEGRYNCQVTGDPAMNQANWLTVNGMSVFVA